MTKLVQKIVKPYVTICYNMFTSNLLFPWPGVDSRSCGSSCTGTTGRSHFKGHFIWHFWQIESNSKVPNIVRSLNQPSKTSSDNRFQDQSCTSYNCHSLLPPCQGGISGTAFGDAFSKSSTKSLCKTIIASSGVAHGSRQSAIF